MDLLYTRAFILSAISVIKRGVTAVIKKLLLRRGPSLAIFPAETELLV